MRVRAINRETGKRGARFAVLESSRMIATDPLPTENDTMTMRDLESDEAYVAIDTNGFVDGACVTQSEDAVQWVAEMQRSGMSVEICARAEAKRILFTNIEESMAVFEA